MILSRYNLVLNITASWFVGFIFWISFYFDDKKQPIKTINNKIIKNKIKINQFEEMKIFLIVGL